MADAGDFRPWILLIGVAIVVAICIQNLWLRRRAERGASPDRGAGPESPAAPAPPTPGSDRSSDRSQT